MPTVAYCKSWSLPLRSAGGPGEDGGIPVGIRQVRLTMMSYTARPACLLTACSTIQTTDSQVLMYFSLCRRPRVPRLNLGVFKTPRGSTMTYDSAAIRPVSSRTLAKAVSDKQGVEQEYKCLTIEMAADASPTWPDLSRCCAAVTMFSNTLYTAEEAASQSSDTIPSWQGSADQQQQSSQIPSHPGVRVMATRASSMPIARGPDPPSTILPLQQLSTTPSMSR